MRLFFCGWLSVERDRTVKLLALRILQWAPHNLTPQFILPSGAFIVSYEEINNLFIEQAFRGLLKEDIKILELQMPLKIKCSRCPNFNIIYKAVISHFFMLPYLFSQGCFFVFLFFVLICFASVSKCPLCMWNE